MSDSSAGQIVGGVVGAVVGFVAGGPVGAVQGFSVGYGIGGYVDPPDGPFISAPRLGDLAFQTSTYGATIPDIYGTTAINGNVIYLENGKYKTTVTEEEQDGKGGGGGATVETVSYSATFAVALSEVVSGAQVRKIWLGGKLFYNNSISTNGSSPSAGTVIQSGVNGQGFKFYDGSQTEPDDRIESVVGIDNAESYEGTAYIIFYDLPLAEYGNSLQGAPVKVEISTNPTSNPLLLSSASTPYDLTGYPDQTNFLAPRAQSFIGLDSYFVGVVQRYGVSLNEKIGEVYLNKGSDQWEITQFTEDGSGSPADGLNDSGLVYLNGNLALGITLPEFNAIANEGYQIRGRKGSNQGLWVSIGEVFASGTKVYTSKDKDNGVSIDSGVCVAVDESLNFVYAMTNTEIIKYTPELLEVSRITHGLSGGGRYGSKMWHDSGRLWVGSAIAGCTLEAPHIFHYIDSDFNSIEHAFDLPRAWIEQNARPFGLDFSISGGILTRGGQTGTDTGFVNVELWNVAGVGVSTVGLGGLVGIIAAKAGISSASIDTTQIDTLEVEGYSVQPSDARGALSQLQAAFLFDVVADGYSLRCVVRGQDPVITIPYGDLGATKSTAGVVDRLEKSRQMDSQLPSRIDINYISRPREYATAVQYAETPTSSYNVKNIDLAIVMSADKAAQLADVLIRLSWISRDTFKFSLPQKYLSLKVSDVVTVQTPDRDYQIRIETINHSLDQIMTVTGKLSAPALYDSSSKGSESEEPNQEIPYITDATGLLVDAPMITESQDRSGFTSSMYGSTGWSGGSLYRSTDGGQTYANLQTYLQPSSVAKAINKIDANDCFVIDRASSLKLSIISGSFSAITQEQMLNGSGWLAYGVDGRWELMRYYDAILNPDGTTSISGLIRGARGTEWATGLHQDNDLVIKLSTSNNYFVGSDIGRLLIASDFKAVTIGQKITDVESFGFTYKGVNLKPLSPVLPIANKGADWVLSCTSRTRYQSSFWVSGSQPQNESALLYELDVLDGDSVMRTIQNSSPEFVYTEAQQIEDFGVSQDEIKANCYQISEKVGRGLPLAFDFVSENFLSPNNPDLLAFYTMSNVSGSMLIDESPNGNHGTLVNSPTIVSGRFGGAMLFDGINQYANIDGEIPANPDSFSWSYWTEPFDAGVPASYSLLSQPFGRIGSSFSAGEMVSRFTDSTGATAAVGAATPSGVFHIVLTYEKVGFLKLYFNGVLVDSIATNFAGSITSTKSTIAANYSGVYGSFHNGTIEQRRTFNRVLTQSEVTTLANET